VRFRALTSTRSSLGANTLGTSLGDALRTPLGTGTGFYFRSYWSIAAALGDRDELRTAARRCARSTGRCTWTRTAFALGLALGAALTLGDRLGPLLGAVSPPWMLARSLWARLGAGQAFRLALGELGVNWVPRWAGSHLAPLRLGRWCARGQETTLGEAGQVVLDGAGEEEAGDAGYPQETTLAGQQGWS
jgi:hypothetical protein